MSAPTPWPGTGAGPVESGPPGAAVPPTKRPPFFKHPESVKNIHSDSRPRGYLPTGGGKR